MQPFPLVSKNGSNNANVSFLHISLRFWTIFSLQEVFLWRSIGFFPGSPEIEELIVIFSFSKAYTVLLAL